MTLKLLWTELCDQGYPYGYAWVCRCCQQWESRTRRTMRMSWRLGEAVFVDYGRGRSGCADARRRFLWRRWGCRTTSMPSELDAAQCTTVLGTSRLAHRDVRDPGAGSAAAAAAAAAYRHIEVRTATVGFDYHVSFLGHWYSVPHQACGRPGAGSQRRAYGSGLPRPSAHCDACPK